MEIVEDESDEEAAFDDSPEGERLHRYQNHWSRMLKRTLDEFDRLHERTEEEPMRKRVPRQPIDMRNPLRRSKK